jgi:lipopolysaccharide transport system ATP-binding protein
MSETAIKVENLYKEYKLGVISHGTLYRDMQSWWAKVRGKEDPNSLISSHHGQEAERDSFLALNDVSFEVKAGDRLGIIGKNGAGKSTLLKILSHITSPTKGTITILGKVGSLLEVGTGFHSELTGRENIYLNGSILGMSRHEISRKLDEIVDFAGIEKHLDTPVKRYSSGMMVRLGFAVAAHLDTDILIADEVLAVGDAEFQKKALDKMGDLSTGEGRTVLFVSHNMGAVKKLCNKGLLLENGKLSIASDLNTIISCYFQTENQLSYIDLTSYKPNYKLTDIQVLSIERISNSNNDNLSFDLYEKISLRLKIMNFASPLMLMVGLSISDIDGHGVIAAINNENEQTFFEKNSMYFVDFHIDNKFLPGKYRVHFGINYKSETIWWGTDIAIFEITNTKKIETPKSGVIFLENKILVTEVRS